MLQLFDFPLRNRQGGGFQVIQKFIDMRQVFRHAIAKRIVCIMLISKKMRNLLATFQDGFDIVAVVEIPAVCLFAGLPIDFLAQRTVVGVG